MILAPILAAQALAALPPQPDVTFTGLPALRARPDQVAIRNHSTTIEVGPESTVVVSVTEVKNRTNGELKVQLHVPRRRFGETGIPLPAFLVTGTWDRAALSFQPEVPTGRRTRLGGADEIERVETDLVTTVTLKPNATHGLRLRATMPLGRAGRDRKRRLVAYLLHGALPIERMNLAYRYKGETVFRLPEVTPGNGWQVGTAGAFRRFEAFVPMNELSTLLFYPGGFDDRSASQQVR